MEIKIEDLQVGDEILTAMGGKLLYLKVLRQPRISPKLGRRGQTRYRTVFCSTNLKLITHKHPSSNYSWTKKQFLCTSESHNHQTYFNLNGKTLWLIMKG